MSEVILNGIEVAGLPATSQVYKATHKGDGSRLSFMDRSFISFSFGGKWVEDYGLIVVIDGDRIGRNLYAEFSDNETESEILDERFFWSSHFNGNNLSLVLSTDGITENQLSEIQRWLKPGNVQELVLSEHPNRAIRAHVAPTPSYNLLPFEEKTEVKVGGLSYKTSTTIYRGDISLSFTMEEPYWYAKSNILCYKEDDDPEDYDSWLSAQGIPAYIYRDPDAAKVILEDGTPINAMLKYPNLLTGSNIVINEATLPNTQVDSAEIDSGRIGPLFIESNGLSMNSGAENAQYFYYGGTAPAKPILQFTLTPTIDEEGYINSPMNSFIDNDSPYNTIVFESKTKKEFRFTTPSIWTGYNQAIAILKKMDGQPLIDVRRALREGVNHWAPRAYAIAVACVSKQVENSVQTQENESEETGTETETTETKTERLDSSESVNKMKNFLKIKKQDTSLNPDSNENESQEQGNNEQQNNDQSATDSSEYYSANFIIDNKTGKVTGEFKFRGIKKKVIEENQDEEENEQEQNEEEEEENEQEQNEEEEENKKTEEDNDEEVTSVEDAGDMIRSNYLIIEDRNYPSPDGYIERWTENPEYSHRVYHDVENGLTNVLLKYKFMYY